MNGLHVVNHNETCWQFERWTWQRSLSLDVQAGTNILYQPESSLWRFCWLQSDRARCVTSQSSDTLQTRLRVKYSRLYRFLVPRSESDQKAVLCLTSIVYCRREPCFIALLWFGNALTLSFCCMVLISLVTMNWWIDYVSNGWGFECTVYWFHILMIKAVFIVSPQTEMYDSDLVTRNNSYK